MNGASEFHRALAKELLSEPYVGKYNELRFGPAPDVNNGFTDRLIASKREVKAQARRRLGRSLGRHVSNRYLPVAARAVGSHARSGSVLRLAETFGHIDEHEQAWNLLADEQSRDVYIRLLALRVFGTRHVRLPLDDERYWREHAIASASEPVGDAIPGALGFRLNLFDLSPFGYDLIVRCRAASILAHCLQRQYELERPEGTVTIEPGDIVIDGGAAWGETALMFSTQAGPTGRVIAVECVPDVLEVFNENMALNPSISGGGRVELVTQALWDVSDETVVFEDNGPGSKVVGLSETANAATARTTVSIDDLVRRLELPRVDFIKMDIEGSELAALEGARDTLKRFRPKLALSAYHKPEDLHVLPQYLADLGVGYRLFLDHFSNHFEETVLFAVAP